MQENQALAPRQAADGLAIELPTELPIRFTGSGSEYFRIWIVNLLLSIVTLGIYSAWAKVRRLKYFYGNTLVDGSPLDYHGKPIAILQGRIAAFVLLMIWNAVEHFGDYQTNLLMLALAMLLLPLLLVRSLRFQFINTSYRGVRFGFAGKTGDAYLAFLLWPLLAIPTLSALVPFAHQRLRRFIQGGIRYGSLPGSMNAGPGAFYKTYAITLLMVAGALAVAGLLLIAAPVLIRMVATVLPDALVIGQGTMAVILIGVLFAMLVLLLLAGPYFVVRIRNLVWSHSAIGEHRFQSRARVRPFIWITVSNFVLVLITLGLFLPFAQIRKARYLIQTMALVPQGSLDDVVATQQDHASALGQETAELFDVDIAL